MHALINETILLLICYHMALLSNLVWEPQIRDIVGYSLTFCLVCLLIGNALLMTMLNVRGYWRKKRISYIKSKHDVVMKERDSALEVLHCANIFNETLDDE